MLWGWFSCHLGEAVAEEFLKKKICKGYRFYAIKALLEKVIMSAC